MPPPICTDCICLLHSTHLLYDTALSLAIVSYLAGRPFGLGLGRRRQAKRSVRRPGGEGSLVCLVATAGKTTGSSLTTVSACCGTHHTDEQPEVQA